MLLVRYVSSQLRLEPCCALRLDLRLQGETGFLFQRRQLQLNSGFLAEVRLDYLDL